MRVVLPPVGMVTFPVGEVVAVGSGLTVTTRPAEMAEQPFALVTLTEYVPDAFTEID